MKVRSTASPVDAQLPPVAQGREPACRWPTVVFWAAVAVLLLLAIWPPTAFRWETGQFADAAAGPTGNVPRLDCFSPPSVAVAVLRLEAERSMWNVVQTQDTGEAAELKLPPEWGRQGAIESRETGVAKAARPLEALEARVGKLKHNLDLKLLAAYYWSGQSNKFLDCYLDLLQDAPEADTRGADAVLWESQAFQFAGQCGRTQEVVRAIRHLIRSQPNLKCVNGLRIVLEAQAGKAPAMASVAGE